MKEKIEDWEKDFDKDFTTTIWSDDDKRILLPEWWKDPNVASPSIVKSFIKKLLQSQTQDIKKKVEAMKGRYKGDGLIGRREDLYDAVLGDVIKELDK